MESDSDLESESGYYNYDEHADDIEN
jgi:hypothetical protein